MENGLANRFSGLNVRDENERSNLNQVIKVIEDAESIIKQQESTIKQQIDENNKLRAELQRRDQELEISKSDKSTVSMFGHQGTLAFHDSGLQNNDPARHSNGDNGDRHFGISRNGEILDPLHGGQRNGDNASFTHHPGRYPMDRGYDAHLNLPAQDFFTELSNSNNLLKQDLLQKVREEHKEEIMLLRKQLTDYSIKETQLRNEKYLLEKNISNMRMAFDKQQQELADAAIKALAYRQDVIEENVRLSYLLQDAQQERSTFVSSLLPVLAEYYFQPSVPDAISIVTNIKVLLKHLQEKLSMTEEKLKESQYQLVPFRNDVSSPQFAPLSPQRSSGSPLYSRGNGLEIVSQPPYAPGNLASDSQMATDWDVRGNHDRQNNVSGAVVEGAVVDGMGRYSPNLNINRNSGFHDGSSQVPMSPDGMYMSQYHGETTGRQAKFTDPARSSAMHGSDAELHYGNREPLDNWGPGPSPYVNTPVETSYSPHLQPVPEEPSSFSEVADDDPLPAIKDLQITGEPYPGIELKATGHSINGTTCCIFEWVRHLEDGSFHNIDGVKEPAYLVTADDVDTSLALEIQPLDDRKRKGELVKYFVNEHRKITCDPEMQSQIDRSLLDGQASFSVYRWHNSLEKREPASLVIKREGYTINSMETRSNVITDKFSPLTTVSITTGFPLEFSITNANGTEHVLLAENVPGINSLRDLIVLTLRKFISKAGEKKKGKKGKKMAIFGF